MVLLSQRRKNGMQSFCGGGIRSVLCESIFMSSVNVKLQNWLKNGFCIQSMELCDCMKWIGAVVFRHKSGSGLLSARCGSGETFWHDAGGKTSPRGN